MSRTSRRLMGSAHDHGSVVVHHSGAREPAEAATCPGNNQTFTWQNFVNVNWQGCKLTNDTFYLDTFSGADLSQTNLSNANFDYGTIGTTSFNSANMNSVDFTGITFDAGNTYTSTTLTNLTGTDLTVRHRQASRSWVGS